MPRFIKTRLKAKGEIPGSLIFIGDQKMEEPRIRIMEYDADKLEEKECQSIEEAIKYLQSPSVTWLNIDGIHEEKVIEHFGSVLYLHPLLMEDIMNSDHRPKFEEEDDLIIILMKFIIPGKEQNKLISEQLSILIGPGFVITLQERIGTHFDPIRDRIRKKKGRIRNVGPDYLAYNLMDTVIDRYIEIIGDIGEHIENLEDEVLFSHSSATAEKLFHYKTEMNYLRKLIRPVREISDKLNKTESELIQDNTRSFFIDLNDHVILAHETIETYISLLNDQMNTYNASMSNKANDIMKILTVFASMFIPLSFVAGVYGMNFKIIPELEWQWGYLFFWIIIISVLSGFFIYFRRKKWF